MATFNIEKGVTDGFRYIGIQPPLTKEQLLQVQRVETSRFMMRLVPRLVEPQTGEPYTELGFLTEAYPSPESANAAIAKVAEDTAEVLSENGNTVNIDSVLKPIGYGFFLFEGQATTLG